MPVVETITEQLTRRTEYAYTCCEPGCDRAWQATSPQDQDRCTAHYLWPCLYPGCSTRKPHAELLGVDAGAPRNFCAAHVALAALKNIGNTAVRSGDWSEIIASLVKYLRDHGALVRDDIIRDSLIAELRAAKAFIEGTIKPLLLYPERDRAQGICEDIDRILEKAAQQ